MIFVVKIVEKGAFYFVSVSVQVCAFPFKKNVTVLFPKDKL